VARGWELDLNQMACSVTVDPTMRALIFDLDCTLVDTVYAHVIAWERA
jgi:hypothetical protein